MVAEFGRSNSGLAAKDGVDTSNCVRSGERERKEMESGERERKEMESGERERKEREEGEAKW